MDVDDNIDSGLFNISISDSEEDDVDVSHGIAQGGAKRDRTGQSEAQFEAVKRDYRAKIENGNIYKSVKLPSHGQQKLSKQEAQELLHAVEELYFYRRYDEAVAFVGRVFEGDGAGEGLERDVRDLLKTYEQKCQGKLGRV
ncbi:hypothetical protein VPNG_07715 [Cytospora leucostoma]|uniref:Uncharacterized protein n=1 Tax=Cytospora leucostoma TaxID=1230097 RepID=A0A423W8F1_9PEZI|nr:hypothetical protein VPNG_07715 [Cytospora leucostoma]